MLRNLIRRPSPAMLVAITALVASFAGPAVADEVARMASHITSKHIKNNTVRSADVRNNSLSSPDFRDGGIATQDIGTGEVHTVDLGDNAVRGDKIQPNTIDASDIQSNSLGGAEINENTLTAVPFATNAGNADTVGGKGADEFESASTLQFIETRMNVNDAERSFTFGPFTVKTRCEYLENDPADETDDQIDPSMVVTTAEDNTFARTDHDDDDDFDRGEELVLIDDAEVGVNDVGSHDDSEWNLMTPSGATITSTDQSWNVVVNAPGLGADCTFFNPVTVE